MYIYIYIYIYISKRESAHQGMVESDVMELLADALDRAGAGDQPLASTLCQVRVGVGLEA